MLGQVGYNAGGSAQLAFFQTGTLLHAAAAREPNSRWRLDAKAAAAAVQTRLWRPSLSPDGQRLTLDNRRIGHSRSAYDWPRDQRRDCCRRRCVPS